MNVRIDVEQVRTVEDGPLYRVATSVVYTTRIDRNIFVFNAATDAFEHVASVWDIDNLPTDKQTALNTSVDYYRLEAVTRDSADVAEASEFAVYTLSRIASLAQSYELVGNEYVGSDTHSYTGI